MTFEILEHVTAAEPVARAEQSMVRMRDGVRLATDVYLPPVPGRHGVVLIRGPYDKNSRYQGLADMAEVFNDRGLVLVAQDVRGKFRSEGVTHPYVSDVADAYDTLDWIIGQSWSNGSVGLVGVSYLGFTVWAGIASGHPAVKGAVPPQGTGVNMARHHLGSPWRQDPAPLLGADDLLQIWADNDIRYLSIDYTRAPLIDTFEEAARSIGVRPPALDDYFRRVRTGDVFNPYATATPTGPPTCRCSTGATGSIPVSVPRDFTTSATSEVQAVAAVCTTSAPSRRTTAAYGSRTFPTQTSSTRG